METRQQRLVREALAHGSKNGHEDREPEASLRDKSLEHTDPAYVPRTLTPHEWETWYAEHGVPPGHRRPAQARQGNAKGPWQRLKALLGGAGKRQAPADDEDS
jgi:hypothetical protein